MNESIATLRFVGRQYGYYPPEHHERWVTDAFTDYVNDFLGKFVTITFFQKKIDEEGQNEYVSALTTMVEHLEKHLAHGKNFIVDDRMSIADFMVASVIFSHVFNEKYIGGSNFTDKGKQVVASHPQFAQYVERLRQELEAYLATRPEAPL